MNIQKQVGKVLATQLKKLGAEEIVIDGQEVDAVPAEVDTDRALMGGSREQRDIDYQFPTQKGLRVRKGMEVKAGGKKWKIENFRRGVAMTTISLIEPNRVEQ